MPEMKHIKKYREILAAAFRADVTVPISDEAIDLLLENAEFVKYRKKQNIVEQGMVDGNMYITANGVNRIAYFDGIKEITLGFGNEGSVFLSPLGFVRGLPSFFSLITVTNCDIFCVPKSKLYELISSSHELVHWLFNLAMAQMYNFEFKMLNGQQTAKERYRNLINRQDIKVYQDHKIRHVDITQLVSDKVLASYLGVIPTHLSNIKKEVFNELKEQQPPTDE